MSVLAACAASLALVATAACKTGEPTSTTHTTSAPIAPAQSTTGTLDTGNNPNDVGNTTGGGANVGTTTSSTDAIQRSRDAGASTTPTGGTDLLDHSQSPTSSPSQQNQSHVEQQSTP